MRLSCRKGGDTQSCLSTNSLKRIAVAYNESIKSSEPRGRGEEIKKGEISVDLPRKELIKEIRKVLISKCPEGMGGHHQDSCILQENPELKNIIEKDDIDNMPPPAPNNKLLTTKPWSTSEVIKAMEYVEKRFPQFIFIEPAPMDFDSKDPMGKCLVSELCNFNILKIIKKGKRQFGLLFNTHPSFRPGGHWICLFCCLETGRCCFYDSYGFLPEEEIVKFMKKIKEQYEKIFKKEMSLLYNDHQNQFKNVECGTFCIFFLIEMAEHGNMRRAVKNLGDDDYIRKRRGELFTYNIE